MGGSSSKEGAAGTMTRSGSAAAFGRLSIHSPGGPSTPGSVRMTLRRRQELLRLAEEADKKAHAGADAGVATEKTSLLQSSSSSGNVQDLHRQLKDVKAAAADSNGASPKDIVDAAGAAVGSPPIEVWIVPALCCAMAYALYNIFIKKGSDHIHPILGGVILQLVAALLGTLLLAFVMLREGLDIASADGTDFDYMEGVSAVMQLCDRQGIEWAILAGLAVGTAEIVSFFVSSLGVQAMQSIPTIIGGSVLFGTVIGAVALHEELSLRGWMGVVLISLGISLVGMDSKGGGH